MMNEKEKESLVEYALSLEKEGKYDEALKIYHSLLQEKFHPAAMNGLIGGLLYYYMKDPISALPYLKENIRLAPKAELASVTLFHALSDMGKIDEAIAEIKRFLSLRDSEEYRQLLKDVNEAYDCPEELRQLLKQINEADNRSRASDDKMDPSND